MLRQLIISSLILTSVSVDAGMRIDDFSTGGNTVDFNNWSGSGNALVDVDFCVTSVLGRTRSSATTAPYEIKLRGRGGNGANAAFQLDPTSGTGSSLPVTITYTDLLSSSSEQLSSNTYTLQDKQGAVFQCPSGSNARLRFAINYADLAAGAAGSYQSRLRIVARGGDNGTETRRKNITLNITIDDIVQLQGIDDLLLGNYSGSGNISATEAFCIYRNGAGAYQVTASGDGSNGAFTLLSNANQIPYTLEWNDSNAFTAMTANNNLTQRQNAVTDINACSSGASNAGIRITLQEQDLSASPSGNYRGTLTLIIAPE